MPKNKKTSPSNPPLVDNEVLRTTDKPASFSDVTLRDLFAAAVLAGLYTNSSSLSENQRRPSVMADIAYEQADEALASRRRHDPDNG